MSMPPLPLDGVMLGLKRKALERERKLDNADDDGEAGAAVDEHSDTWAFSWMPAIEDFVEFAAARAYWERDDHSSTEEEEETLAIDGEENSKIEGESEPATKLGLSASVGMAANYAAAVGEPVSRKRMRPPSAATASSERRPRPLSYNETLLADKAFRNPHGSETMADAFGIVPPFSFLVDVDADDRTWGSAAAAAAASRRRGEGSMVVEENEGREEQGEGNSRSWFYDTVRDRQNRLWADARVKKGVELARKGQHQLAIDTYTQALGMCPDHEDGLVARGAGYASTGRLRQALQDLSRALSLNPNNENASNYLKETRRRMNNQGLRESPAPSGLGSDRTADDLKPWDASNNETQPEEGGAAGARVGGVGLGGSSWQGTGSDAARSALTALMQDGAEGEALRKMRLLLEEDEKKRRRERKGVGGGGSGGGVSDGEGYGSSHNGKKKSRHKEKKSGKGSRRSSHHKKDQDKDKGRKRGRRRDASDGDSSSSSDDAGRGGGLSSGSTKKCKKKKQKRKHKSGHKKERVSRKDDGGANSMSPPPSALLGTSLGSSRRNGDGLPARAWGGSWQQGGSSGDEGSGGETAHPILHRKKHSLWG